MTRLFLSLYAFIAITLVVLSAVLNYVFFADSVQAPAHKHLLNTLSAIQQSSGLNDTVLEKSGLVYRKVLYFDMPWSPKDTYDLEAGQGLVLFDESSKGQVYFKIDNRTLYEIDLPDPTQEQGNFYWYSAVFFALLALGTAIWVWPLWRDLQSLKQAAKQSNFSEDFEPIGLQPHSLVYPIGQSLDELNAKVRELIKTQMELTGAVAHEFRTPLSRLKFALAAQTFDDSAAEEAIQQDIDELEKLMHEMLSYTSLENHQPELNISEIPLTRLCEQRVAAISNLIDPRMKIDLCGDDVTILADEKFIERVFDNLLQNALRHGYSHILIKVKRHKSEIILSIDDDGKGIAPEHMDKVFEPFFRLDPSRARIRGGAGLGLAIVRRIVAWHQARCWAEASTLGGARFCVAFSANE